MIEEILIYQEKDAELNKIELEISKSEERKLASSAKKTIELAEENTAKLDMKAKELTCAYENILEEKKKLEEQQAELLSAIETVADKNGADFILKKIDELIVKIKNASNDLAKITANIKQVINDYAITKSQKTKAKVVFAENSEKYKALKDSKKEQVDKLLKELEKLKKKVDPNIMALYMKKREAKIFPILFEAENDSCGACRMGLSVGTINKLKSGQIIECENCRKLIYKKS